MDTKRNLAAAAAVKTGENLRICTGFSRRQRLRRSDPLAFLFPAAAAVDRWGRQKIPHRVHVLGVTGSGAFLFAETLRIARV